MFEKRYKEMNQTIKPNSQLTSDTIYKMQTGGQKRRKTGLRRLVKPLVALAAMFAVLLVGLPVLSANVPAVYNAIYAVAPALAQRMMPINESCESNGIRMEVVAASVDGNTAVFDIALTDLTGERLDETTDLYDSYSIRRGFDASAHCEFLGYDAATQTATFRCTIEQWDNRPINGQKITFQLGCFLSQRLEYELELPVELGAVQAQAGRVVSSASISGGGGSLDLDADYRLLETPEQSLYSRDGIARVMAAGLIDGRLHVQLEILGKLEYDNHAWVYLIGPGDEKIECESVVYFTDGQGGETRYFSEYIFGPSVSAGQLAECKLGGRFIGSNLRTDGDWQVTFAVPQQ